MADVKVEVTRVPAYEAAFKALLVSLEDCAFPVVFDTYATDDSRYYIIYGLEGGYAAVDGLNRAWRDAAAKTGPARFETLRARVAECELERVFRFWTFRTDLSYLPVPERLKPAEIGYYTWDYVWLVPGKEAEFEALDREWMVLSAARKVRDPFMTYQGGYGNDEPVYVWFEYGRTAADYALTEEKFWKSLGVMIYTLIDAMMLSGMLTKPVLVLGPLRVSRDTWTDEALKWQHLRDIETVFPGGTKPQREAAACRDAQVYTSNYEQIPWLVERFGKNWPFGMVVADEATRLKGFRLAQGTRRAQALSKVAFCSDYWINLTGTPAPNGLIDLWGQTWFLDQGERLGLTYNAFCERWFYRPPRGDDDNYASALKPHRHSQAEIYAQLRDICLTLDPRSWQLASAESARAGDSGKLIAMASRGADRNTVLS